MKWLSASMIMVCLMTSTSAQEGRLEAVRQDVRSPATESPRSSSSSASANSDEDLDGLLAYVGCYVVATPFAVPYYMLGDSYSNKGVFLAYPYAEKWRGIMQMEVGLTKDGVTPDTWSRLMSVRASVEEGNNFNGINRVGITFLADTMLRLGIGGSVQLYEEKQQANSPDQLTIGDVNALFRFAQSDRTQFRAGIGTRFLNDTRRTDWGINFVYGFEFFPHDPWTFGTQLETGTLGNAWVFRSTTRLGVNWKRAEAYLGYDYLRIGSTELQGPMVGLRLWF